MRANEIQVGGDHYKGRDTQHWDVIDRSGIGYLEGVATKYLCRYREKNGVQDLRKAEHYVMKLLEEVNEHGRRPRGIVSDVEISSLATCYDLEVIARGAVRLLLHWSRVEHLEAALSDVRELIQAEESSPSSVS